MEEVREGLFYTKEHEWVKIEDNFATFGITDHAQHALGDVTFVELPKAGAELAQGKMFATIESVKAASDVFAPLSGIVVKVNSDLVNKPESINKSPYGEAWFVAVEIKNEAEKKNLMDAAAYKDYLGGLK
ncbi:MAG: glycine cleavage system protein GcvH [Candidatus Omnitrophota bacterium]|nr:glycine cleavage system protein GcvH [Candidatus Omnitrophota bacterium]MBU1929062.1 glycine cleavage system protein GcvH [Candidatus Omnitrophota bacterium]MBU2034403.1 glycine cleavage system protein GcvH [Candidatus Omnitrophota bacterium]MBU2221877.1 glycine cleavage system protein GcvH [Candidatus Omnitrophota bacterium]MBU2257543.1 glycine cleavage system protein GcvH [Candidatus Omnitrophota bacterium]